MEYMPPKVVFYESSHSGLLLSRQRMIKSKNNCARATGQNEYEHEWMSSNLRAEAPSFVPALVPQPHQPSEKPETSRKAKRKPRTQKKPSARRTGTSSAGRKNGNRNRNRRDPQEIRKNLDPDSQVAESIVALKTIEQDKDELFPCLGTATPLPQQSSLWNSSDALRAKLKEEPKLAVTEENDKNRVVLTLLKPKKTVVTTVTTETGGASLTEEDEVDPQNSRKDCAAQPKAPRQTDITRLRDRWWALLKERPIHVLQNEKDTKTRKQPDEPESDDLSSCAEPVDLVPLKHAHTPLQSDAIGASNLDHDSKTLTASIQQNDHNAVDGILSSTRLTGGCLEEKGVIQFAVTMNRPKTLRLLLTAVRCRELRVEEDREQIPALLIAAKNDCEECLHILIASGVYPMTISVDGTNILHLCCRKRSQFSFLEYISKTVRNHLSSWAKLMLMKNSKYQTPLHVACQNGRLDLVEHLLGASSYSLLSKVLVSQDRDAQTPLLTAVQANCIDIVVTFLMWRGNNSLKAPPSLPCPLVWAVKCGRVEIVWQLLEFSSRDGYNLNDALFAVAKQEDLDDDTRQEMVVILIEHGANACSKLGCPEGRTLLEEIVLLRDAELLSVTVQSHRQATASHHTKLRQDPALRQQPESFFSGKESRARAEESAAIRKALLFSLFLGSSDASFLECSLVLYRSGGKLGDSEFGQLMESFQQNRLVESFTRSVPVAKFSTEIVYDPPKSLEAPLHTWSQDFLGQMPWLVDSTEACSCILFRESQAAPHAKFPRSDLVLVSNEGDEFECHSELISSSCGKLEAAIRFYSLSKADVPDGCIRRLPVGMSSSACRSMLEHVYHGSIISGLSPNAELCCEQLLSLAVAAEELLCHSLIQECEIRLLSSDPLSCFCDGCLPNHSMNLYNSPTPKYVTVTGPPLCLLPSTTAFDAVAVSRCISGRIPCNAYSVQQKSKNKPPLHVLGAVATETILKNFDQCVRSTERDFEADSNRVCLIFDSLQNLTSSNEWGIGNQS